MRRLIFILFVLLSGMACHSTQPLIFEAKSSASTPNKFSIFLDGTANNEKSLTNISKLYQLTVSANLPNSHAIYLPGVGNGANVLGKVTGAGMRAIVCEAYLYLAENHQLTRADEIYIFGFSRGAYAARILAGFIHVAGIINLDDVPKDKRLSHIKRIFNAHKIEASLADRREAVETITGQGNNSAAVKIEFLGLWDTVEALGLPNSKEQYYQPDNKYVDQLCNVKRAAQAMSLNDSRSTTFTPVLLNNDFLVSDCRIVKPAEIVNEVWFFGDHSDVGGFYTNSALSGVSLNWMIQQIEPHQLLPKGTKVEEDIFGPTYNSRSGAYKLIYSEGNRKLAYLVSAKGYKKEKLKIHSSVFERMRKPMLPHELNLLKLFSECFERNEEGGWNYKEESDCFEQD